VDKDHTFIVNFFEEMNNLLKGREEKQPSKKITNLFSGLISKKHLTKDSFKKEDVPHKEFLEDLGLLIVKNNLPI